MALLRNMICNSRHPLGVRHPVHLYGSLVKDFFQMFVWHSSLRTLQCVAACCSVRCSVRCSVLQCVVVRVATHFALVCFHRSPFVWCSVLQCVAVKCSLRSSVLQCDTVCCSELQ